MKISRLYSFAMIMILTFFVINCGKKPTPQSGDLNRPKWVDMGAGAFTGDMQWGNAFYGVGSYSNEPNVSLRRRAADRQALVDIASVFKTIIANLTKIYQETASDLEKSKSANFASDVTSALTSMDLAGVMIIDRYYSVEEKTQYSLAILNAESFKNEVERLNSLSDEMRDTIKKHADSAFEELSKEVNN